MIRRSVSSEKALPVGSSSPSVSYGLFVFCSRMALASANRFFALCVVRPSYSTARNKKQMLTTTLKEISSLLNTLSLILDVGTARF